MSFAIRRAEVVDAEALALLGAETFRETFGHLYPPEDLAHFLDESHSPAAWRKVLEDPALRTWVAEEGALVGYALAGPCKLPHPEVTPDAGELKRLYVARSHQGSGVGRRLLDEALGWLEAQGRTPLWIGVYSENHRAQKIYEARGFVQVGEYEFPVGKTRDRELILRRSG
jgi:ribosomal protein S18 acetylase RimI-like enzyme